MKYFTANFSRFCGTTVKIYKDRMSDLKYMTVNDGSLEFKCVNCVKCMNNYEKKFDEILAKIIENTSRFCDGDI